jgi:uncharacterized protein YbgA (DUF1722 family)
MPLSVIDGNGKAHLTKSQKKLRKQGEEALATGAALKERSEVKNNPIAHKEFLRISKLLEKINKNDAIYEVIINRYCTMVAECFDLEEKREASYQIMLKLDENFNSEIDNTPEKERAQLVRSYARAHADLMNSLLCCDSQVQSKRKMLLDIEKENIMTIAAALRSIPKKDAPKGQSLADILKNG